MKHIKIFENWLTFENHNQSEYSVRQASDTRVQWYKGNKRCGVFDFTIKDNDIYIVGYMKDDKSVDGYEFIKLSIDYLLENKLNYKFREKFDVKSIISNGNRSPAAGIVWNRLANESKYNIKTIERYNFDGYISDRHSIKIITLNETYK